MEHEKYCLYCSNSFVTGVDPIYDGFAGTVGKSDGSVNIMVSSDGLNKPAPISIEVWRWSKEIKQNERIAYFVPLYCAFCGRKIIENLSYLESLPVIKRYKK